MFLFLFWSDQFTRPTKTHFVFRFVVLHSPPPNGSNKKRKLATGFTGCVAFDRAIRLSVLRILGKTILGLELGPTIEGFYLGQWWAQSGRFARCVPECAIVNRWKLLRNEKVFVVVFAPTFSKSMCLVDFESKGRTYFASIPPLAIAS